MCSVRVGGKRARHRGFFAQPSLQKCALVIFRPSDSDGLRGRLTCRTFVAWLCWQPASLLHSLISLLSDDSPPTPRRRLVCILVGQLSAKEKKKKKAWLFCLRCRSGSLDWRFCFFFVPCQGKKKVLCKDAGSGSERRGSPALYLLLVLFYFYVFGNLAMHQQHKRRTPPTCAPSKYLSTLSEFRGNPAWEVHENLMSVRICISFFSYAEKYAPC